MHRFENKRFSAFSAILVASVCAHPVLAEDSFARIVHNAQAHVKDLRKVSSTSDDKRTSSKNSDDTSGGDTKNNSAKDSSKEAPPAADASPTTGTTSDEPSLRGNLTITARTDSPAAILADLLHEAVTNDARIQDVDQKRKHYSRGSDRALEKTRDMANFVLSYKGFERSSEAADVILSEKIKAKSRASSAYLKQKLADEHAMRIYSAMMQIAAASGSEDPSERSETIDAAVQSLTPTVGEAKARETVSRIQSWADTVSDADSQNAKPMNVLQVEKRVDEAVNSALKKDDVVNEIQHSLHKFNHRSNAMRVTAKIFNTACSIAMFSPNFVSPAAQVAYLTFCLSTGGPEDAKLLKELYYDQRFHSRWKVYNHNATLAVNNYNVALASKNKVLQRFCQSTLSDMESAAPDTANSSVPGKAGDTASSQTATKPTKTSSADESRTTDLAAGKNEALR